MNDPVISKLNEMQPLPLRFAEIGVLEGTMTVKVLSTVPSIRRYYCIDPWKLYPDFRGKRTDESLERAYKKFLDNTRPYIKRIMILRMMSERAALYIDDGSIDSIYIDANHEEKYVEQDVELWYPKLRVGGLFFGDDYRLGEGRGGRPEWGVKTVIDRVFAGKANIYGDCWWLFKE